MGNPKRIRNLFESEEKKIQNKEETLINSKMENVSANSAVQESAYPNYNNSEDYVDNSSEDEDYSSAQEDTKEESISNETVMFAGKDESKKKKIPESSEGQIDDEIQFIDDDDDDDDDDKTQPEEFETIWKLHSGADPDS